MASSFWSMFSGKASSSGASPDASKTSPKIQGSTGPSRPSPGDTTMSDPIRADIDDDDLFGQPSYYGAPAARAPIAPLAAPQQVFTRPPMPPPKAGEVPDFYVKKVEAYITDHFYDIEGRMKLLEHKLTEVVQEVNKREDQVAQVFQQVKQLIELQFAETKKGVGRDQEMLSVAEQFEKLRMDAMVKQTEAITKLADDLDKFHGELKEYGNQMMEDLQNQLRKRDDATYRFEADLMAVKKSFSSLRLEFQKSKKGQDFKNTSTTVFVLKAIDMKPEERKRVLRTLTEQEEKNRGAVTKAETDLREHETALQNEAHDA